MNCIIIDDEAIARTILLQLCADVEQINIVENFPNAIQAIKYLNKNRVDLIFLDIHMPDFTGFDFIQTLNNPPQIILTTSDKNFAIEAFGYDCVVDYLVKPIELPRFLKAIHRVENTIKKIASVNSLGEERETDKELYVNINRRLIKIDIASIYLIEANGDYILIKTEKENYTVHQHP